MCCEITGVECKSWNRLGVEGEGEEWRSREGDKIGLRRKGWERSRRQF